MMKVLNCYFLKDSLTLYNLNHKIIFNFFENGGFIQPSDISFLIIKYQFAKMNCNLYNLCYINLKNESIKYSTLGVKGFKELPGTLKSKVITL